MSCVCGIASENVCGGCSKVVYCSRECQMADRASHRESCRLDAFYNSWIDVASERIGGNIEAMISKYRGMNINVRIDETIADFVRGNSLHFAHMSVSDPAAEPVLRFQLVDYTRTKKYVVGETTLTPPGDEWTITFDM